VIPWLIATTVILVAVASGAAAWADHGGLSSAGLSPVVTALLWAGGTFLAGIAVIAIVTVLSRSRRRSPPPPDA
jgi:hypothetical protein